MQPKKDGDLSQSPPTNSGLHNSNSRKDTISGVSQPLQQPQEVSPRSPPSLQNSQSSLDHHHPHHASSSETPERVTVPVGRATSMGRPNAPVIVQQPADNSNKSPLPTSQS